MTKRTKRIVIWSMLAATLVALAIPKIFTDDADASGAGERGGAQAGARPVSGSGGGAGRGGGAGGGRGPVSVQAVVVAREQLDDALRVTGTLLPNEQVDLQSE